VFRLIKVRIGLLGTPRELGRADYGVDRLLVAEIPVN
jgi:hypothetical protein